MTQSNQNLSPRADATDALEAGLYAASHFLADTVHDADIDAEQRMRAIGLAIEVHQHLLTLGGEAEMLNEVEPTPKVTPSYAGLSAEGAEEF